MMNKFTDFDISCMQHALQLASTAATQNEVPVGAVLVRNSDQVILGCGANSPIRDSDPTAHAEINAMRAAGKSINNYRLIDTTLYVTLEPCAMCAGAILHARVKRLIYATPDPRAGAIGGAMNLYAAAPWNHRVECAHGLLAEPCASLLRAFFQDRR